MFHWTTETGVRVKTLCGLAVSSAWCARGYRGITCKECLKRVPFLMVTCPIIINAKGERLRGCGDQYQISKTRCTRSFLRLCPKCDPAKLPIVLDHKGNRVYLPPENFLAGYSGENDEAVKGIKIKGNQ